MPLYVYKCPNAHFHDELKPIALRATDPCPECGELAEQVLTPVRLDWTVGVDSDFPTFAAKWEKIQRNKGSGKTKDSNNERYGGNYQD